MNQAAPKVFDAWSELQRRQGNPGNRPQYYTPDVIVPGANFGYATANIDNQMLHACFPKLDKLMADTATRVAAEGKEAAERRAAAAPRRRDEEERHQRAVMERAKREADAAAARNSAGDPRGGAAGGGGGGGQAAGAETSSAPRVPNAKVGDTQRPRYEKVGYVTFVGKRPVCKDLSDFSVSGEEYKRFGGSAAYK
jgi:hypothetical protein